MGVTWTQTALLAPADRRLADEERQRCEVWSRVMGYHRPVNSWNVGKRSEWKERLLFREPHEREGKGTGDGPP